MSGILMGVSLTIICTGSLFGFVLLCAYATMYVKGEFKKYRIRKRKEDDEP